MVPAAVKASGGWVPVYAFVQDVVNNYIAYDQYQGIGKFIARAFPPEVVILRISSYMDGAIRRYSLSAKTARVGYLICDEFFEVPYVRPSQRARALSTIARHYP